MESIVMLAVLLFVFHVAVIVSLYRSISAKRSDNGGDTGDREALEPITYSMSLSDSSNPSEDDREDGSTSLVQCQTCGVPNDPAFRFCRHCVTDLSDGNALYRDRPTG